MLKCDLFWSARFQHDTDVFEPRTSSGNNSLLVWRFHLHHSSELESSHFATYNLTISLKSYKEAPEKKKAFSGFLIDVLYCCTSVIIPVFRYYAINSLIYQCMEN